MFVLLWIEQSDCDGKKVRTCGSREENQTCKTDAEPSSEQQNSQPPEPPKQDYIHVRARRGQATDSHSLAERVYFSWKHGNLNCF